MYLSYEYNDKRDKWEKNNCLLVKPPKNSVSGIDIKIYSFEKILLNHFYSTNIECNYYH